jgi:hypothetical protein
MLNEMHRLFLLADNDAKSIQVALTEAADTARAMHEKVRTVFRMGRSGSDLATDAHFLGHELEEAIANALRINERIAAKIEKNLSILES